MSHVQNAACTCIVTSNMPFSSTEAPSACQTCIGRSVHSISCSCAASHDSCGCRYRLPSQQHFYMEPQAAVAVPGENGCLSVHSATQSLDAFQASVAQALGMPANKVNVGAPCAAVGLLCAGLQASQWR